MDSLTDDADFIVEVLSKDFSDEISTVGEGTIRLMVMSNGKYETIERGHGFDIDAIISVVSDAVTIALGALEVFRLVLDSRRNSRSKAELIEDVVAKAMESHSKDASHLSPEQIESIVRRTVEEWAKRN